MKKQNLTNKQIRNRYWLHGGLGTAILGFGLCAFLESGFLKHSEVETWKWVVAGTGSLIFIMTGINFLFESYSCKQHLDRLK